MTPQYTREELINMIKTLNYLSPSAILNIPFSIGQNNLISYIDRNIAEWSKDLKLKNNFLTKIAKESIADLYRFKTIIFCDKEELPLFIEGKFKEIVQWRLQKDK